MHINDLETEILENIFAFVRSAGPCSDSERPKRLHLIASVCSLWREVMLPHIYKRLRFDFNTLSTGRKAQRVTSKEETLHARIVDIRIEGPLDENVDFAALFNEARIGERVWPRITKLHVMNDNRNSNEKQIRQDLQVEGDRARNENAMAEYLNRHFPNVTELRYKHVDFTLTNKDNKVEPIFLFLQVLFKGFAAQLAKLDLEIHNRLLSEGLSFPHQLSYLAISMRQYECRMLPRLYAHSLQYLRIKEASHDITWNWFTGGDGKDAWFYSLRTLLIEFSGAAYRPSYLNHDLPDVSSDYKGSAKLVHFPVLENLRIANYPFMDDSFYTLFEDCPLKTLHCQSPNKPQHHIPARMLAKLEYVDAYVHYLDSRLTIGGSRQNIFIPKQAAYKQGLEKLLSAYSTARHVCLRSRLGEHLSLPRTISWTFVQSLELQLYIDWPSIFNVLENMPRLKHFEFGIYLENLSDASFESAGTEGAGNQQLHVVNKSVECVSMSVKHLLQAAECVKGCWFRNLLPSVPSLLKLRVNTELADTARKAMADPNNSFGWMSQKLEIVELEC